MNESRLEVRDLFFSYRGTPRSSNAVHALHGLSLVIEQGEYWCLAGPNGSGKSTLLKLVSGLFSTFDMKRGLSGTLNWAGRSVLDWLTADRLEFARQVAFVASSLRTDFPVTVEEFVLQGRYARSPYWAKPAAQDRSIAASAIDSVGIKTRASRLITELSAGETQLAMIARALAQEPRLLILDESTSSLDPGFQAKIFSLLARENARGTSILVVSHDLNLAAEFCPRVIWLSDGKIIAKGSAEKTLTAALLHKLYGTGNLIEVGKNPFSGKPKIFWTALFDPSAQPDSSG